MAKHWAHWLPGHIVCPTHPSYEAVYLDKRDITEFPRRRGAAEHFNNNLEWRLWLESADPNQLVWISVTSLAYVGCIQRPGSRHKGAFPRNGELWPAPQAWHPQFMNTICASCNQKISYHGRDEVR